MAKTQKANPHHDSSGMFSDVGGASDESHAKHLATLYDKWKECMAAGDVPGAARVRQTIDGLKEQRAIAKAKQRATKGESATFETTIKKTEESGDQRLVWGEVYAPNRPDSHGEFMTEEDIRVLAYRFLALKLTDAVDTNHDNRITKGVNVVESFVAREGDPDFIAGSWVVCVHVADDDLWDQVKKGELNGFSMEALVAKEDVEVEIEIPNVIKGSTSESDGHTHKFAAEYDDDGKFLGGVTDVVDGHSHQIRTGTVTQVAKGHSHRFSSVDNVVIAEPESSE
jgi:Putative phage serine protease XkdF